MLIAYDQPKSIDVRSETQHQKENLFTFLHYHYINKLLYLIIKLNLEVHLFLILTKQTNKYCFVAQA